MHFWKYGSVALVAALFAHIAFLFMFYYYGVMQMVYINIVSILLFAYCISLLPSRKYSLILLLAHTEVVIHAIAGTYFIGYMSGFYYYLFVLVILSFFTIDKYPSIKVGKIVFLMGLFFFMEIVYMDATPPYYIDSVELSIIRYANLMGFLLLSIPIVYYYTVNATRTNDRLIRYAIRDELTGLYNRRYLASLAEHEFSKRNDENPLSLVLADIDHFKKINDTYGHQCGDVVLQEIGKCLQKHLRDADVVARWGGEEFLFIFPNTKLEHALEILQRLQNSIRELSFECEDVEKSLRVTMTYGVARREDSETFDATLARADVALYKGKTSGRDRIEISSFSM